MKLNVRNVFHMIIVTTENIKNYTPILPGTLSKL